MINPIDVALIGIMAIGFSVGVGLGFIRLALPFATAVAIWAALRYQPQVATFLATYANLKPELAQVLGYVAVAVGAVILTGIMGAALQFLVKIIPLTDGLNRLAGSAVGLLFGTVLAALVVVALDSYGDLQIRASLDGSMFAEPLRVLLTLGFRELGRFSLTQ